MASYQILPREQSRLPRMKRPKALTLVSNTGQPERIVRLDEETPQPGQTGPTFPNGGFAQSPQKDLKQGKKAANTIDYDGRYEPAAAPPRTADERQQDDLDAAIAKYTEAVNRVPKNSNSRVASFFKMLAHGAAESFGGRPAKNWGEFAAMATRAGVTGVSGLVHPEWDEALQRERDIESTGKDAEGLLKIASARSTIRSRDSLADYRQSKLEMDTAYRRFLAGDKKRRTDGYLTRLDFLNQYGDQMTIDRQHKQKWLEETETTRQTTRDATLGLARERFDYRKERDKLTYELQKRRTAAYERSVQNSANKADASMLADQAESDYLEGRADDYEDKAAELEATGDPEDEVEARQLRSAARTARDKAAARGYRGNAGAASRGDNEALKGFSEDQVRAFGRSKKLTGAKLEGFVEEWRKRTQGNEIAPPGRLGDSITGGASGRRSP